MKKEIDAMTNEAARQLLNMLIENSGERLRERAFHVSKPTRWQRFTWLAYRKWKHALHDWIHRDCC